MAVEFKNSNQFRSYPFLDDGADSPFSRGLSKLFVDARINLYTDLIRDEGEILVAGISDVEIIAQGAGGFNIEIMIAGGVRDSGDNIILNGSGSGRHPIRLTLEEVISGDPLSEDPEYMTFWIYFDSHRASTTPTLFDGSVTSDDEFEGTEFVVSGYITVSKRELSQLPDKVLATGMLRFASETGVVITDTAACFEDALLHNISSQVCRRVFLANKDPIPAPDNNSSDNERFVRRVAGVFDGDVILHQGLNCKIDLDTDNSKLTITPSLGAGDGHPCNSSEDSEAEFCSDLIFAINSVTPDSGGRVNFGSVSPLQVAQFIPNNPAGFATIHPSDLDGFTAQTFWEHCLVFRIGDWGVSDNTPCEPPDCPSSS